jgi:Domain of unknown function (DUF929)
MAKPKRRQRHPAATVGQQSSAKRTGASATGGVGKGSVQKKVTDSTKVVSTGTSSGAGVERRAPPAARAATETAGGSAAMRQRVQARSNQRRYARRRAWWSGPMPILLFSVGGVVLIVGIFILIAHSQNSGTGAAHSVPGVSVLNVVEHPNSTIFTQVGAGTSSANLFVALPNKSGTDLPAQNGKPVLLYIGAEYCPFCAADRWSLIMALSRFGSFSGIEANASTTSDIYPGTPHLYLCQGNLYQSVRGL